MSHAPTQYYHPSRVVLENLISEHYTVVEQTISTILSTKLETEAFVQVVDGISILVLINPDVYK